MTPTQCPELEVLFTELEVGEGPALEHAAACPLCSAILEEHRQLEKDLYRLADPLPPPALVATVMARVAVEPPPLRRELWAGVSILAVSLFTGLGLLISNDRALSHLGLALASLVSDGKSLALDLANGGSALWNIAAGPITAILLSMLFVCLFGLKRLAGSPPPLTEA
ncbi:hypothetical protein POL68_04480 [Stigmatella sp. ncwal1]|uniref:Zinc-finger domain-containing protein n=1 Tax=Stigmatella ashevillensis TaxID=2995309 RepID=A0ABT5D659_9BACT|nr:hypothetical protein [Stigmatella ashevillena]MDC0707717.1 hypothetical protein [Stigmatella ashevillena]